MRIKNWETFQHFKDRKPSWVKLYRDLLEDLEWFKLSPESSKVLVMCWLIASEYDGHLPDAKELAWRLRIENNELCIALKEIVASGFIIESDKENPEKVSSRDIAKKNGFGSRYIPNTIKQEVYKRDSGKCCYCDSVAKIEYDHILPVSRGGESTLDNLQLLCRSCNRKKRATMPAQIEAEQVGCDERSLETEVEKETEKTKPDKYRGDFKSTWKRYPNKTGKPAAEKRFNKTVKSAEDESAINKALDIYLQHLAKETWKRPQNGSTWFNSWEEWVDFEDSTEFGVELTPQQKQAQATGGAVY